MASGRAIMLRVTLDCIADGKPISIMESGAILMYLAEKKGDGKFLSHDPRLKWETIQWLFFQMGGIGPMFGQVPHQCIKFYSIVFPESAPSLL
jgi:glutathione S-transferase